MTIPVKIGPCLCGEPEKLVTNEAGEQYIQRCPLYTRLSGAHPQTGEPIDEWACAIAWLPMLLIENRRATDGAQKATESLRNEMVTGMLRAQARTLLKDKDDGGA